MRAAKSSTVLSDVVLNVIYRDDEAVDYPAWAERIARTVRVQPLVSASGRASVVIEEPDQARSAVRAVIDATRSLNLMPSSNPGVQMVLRLAIAQHLMQLWLPSSAFTYKGVLAGPYRDSALRRAPVDIHAPELALQKQLSYKLLCDLPEVVVAGGVADPDTFNAYLQDMYAATMLAKHERIDVAIPLMQPEGLGFVEVHCGLVKLQREYGLMHRAHSELMKQTGSSQRQDAQVLTLMMRGCGLLIKQYFQLSEKLLAQSELDAADKVCRDLSDYRTSYRCSDINDSIIDFGNMLSADKLKRRIGVLASCVNSIVKADAASTEEEKLTHSTKRTDAAAKRYAMFVDSELSRPLLADGDAAAVDIEEVRIELRR